MLMLEMMENTTGIGFGEIFIMFILKDKHVAVGQYHLIVSCTLHTSTYTYNAFTSGWDDNV